MLTDRWSELRAHGEQSRLWRSSARYRVVPAGRRSGKTELAKRYLVKRALEFHSFSDGWFVCSCPTHSQAKRIYWRDLKKLVPRRFIDRISESELTIDLWNGARIQVMGLDVPERIEGPALDGIVLDEYANMKSGVWDEHVGPALDTPGRPGWAWFIGVPEAGGANDYEDLFDSSRSSLDEWSDWDGFSWESADILDPDVIARVRARMDSRTFDQEYRAQFINVGGRTYYDFSEDNQREGLRSQYDQSSPLLFCFDFNVEPGTASVLQYFDTPSGWPTFISPRVCGCIGEVYVPRDSNTPRVCSSLIQGWGSHQGNVICYGDATGGARGTAQTEGSDWDLIRKAMKAAFGPRVQFKVPRGNPSEKSRVNAMNSRIRASDGSVRFLVDPAECPHVVRDFLRVTSDSEGRIDKRKDGTLTHITDEIGYWAVHEHPVGGKGRLKIERGF